MSAAAKLLREHGAKSVHAFVSHFPLTAKGSRKMRHRWNESVTRYRRFRDLGCLPAALPWVVKPLAVGLLPEGLLKRLKKG